MGKTHEAGKQWNAKMNCLNNLLRFRGTFQIDGQCWTKEDPPRRQFSTRNRGDPSAFSRKIRRRNKADSRGPRGAEGEISFERKKRNVY